MKILLVSDIHANLVAFDAVLEDAGEVEQVWCLGDIVGYGPEPNACVERLRALKPLCIAGNHDWAVLEKLDLAEFNPDARAATLWTREQLTPHNLDWLHQLPDRVPPELGKFTLVHGSPRHPIWEYVLGPAVARINFDYFDTQICLIGHTHIPVLYRLNAEEDYASADSPPENEPLELGDERLMLNPGSVGQPRDGDPRAAYAILDTAAQTFLHKRVEYDIAATQARMREAGLPARLINRLSAGW
jgi:predicted phosphodiesterase